MNITTYRNNYFFFCNFHICNIAGFIYRESVFIFYLIHTKFSFFWMIYKEFLYTDWSWIPLTKYLYLISCIIYKHLQRIHPLYGKKVFSTSWKFFCRFLCNWKIDTERSTPPLYLLYSEMGKGIFTTRVILCTISSFYICGSICFLYICYKSLDFIISPYNYW